MDTFQIFLTILFILVLSIIIINFFIKSQQVKTENFQGLISSNKSVLMPQYSQKNTLIALDYNIFFDELNGNVVISSVDFVSLQNNSYISNDVKYIVINRNGNYSMFDSIPSSSSNIQPAPTTVSSSYTSWIFPNKMNINLNDFTLNCQIIYIPYGTDTYIQLIHQDGASSFFDICFFFGYGGARNVCSNSVCDSVNKILNPSLNVTDTNINNNSYVIDNFYDPGSIGYLYQMSNFVEFDIYSGNLVVTQFYSGNQREIVYNRIDGSMAGNNNTYNSPQQILDNNSTIPNNNLLNSWSIVDIDGNNMVTYIGMAQNTIICISQKDPNDSDAKCFKLVNVKRFDAYGNVVDGTNQNNNPKDKCDNSDAQDYYKWYWYWYWNMNGNDQNVSNATPTPTPSCTTAPPSCTTAPPTCTTPTPNPTYTPQVQSNDYILKTQIVPPVCPAFPFEDYESDSDEDEYIPPTTPAPTTPAPTTSAPTTPAPQIIIKDVDIPATPGVGNLPPEPTIITKSSYINSSGSNNNSNSSNFVSDYKLNSYPVSSNNLKMNNKSNNFIPITNDFSKFAR